MQKIYYLKLQHFKTFGDEVTLDFDETTVLIGANNAGKTTAIQALALWSWAVRKWFEKKKNTESQSERNKGVALNRLDIAQVPIKEMRYFWNNAKVRQNSTNNIGLTIKVGLWFEQNVYEVGMVFKYHSLDLMYCQPTPETLSVKGLMEYASNLKVNLLYPMSGMSDKEFVLREDAIRTLIGIGQTSQVIRNICYSLYNKEENGKRADWDYFTNLMGNLFAIKMNPPTVRATGEIEVMYNYIHKKQQTDYDLDITLAGRGQQQMMLVLAYLIANKDAILLIDEPDAHLEILRQNQIFSVLKGVASQYNCQVIIVTHSEVVLNEANSVVFLSDGKAQPISDKKEHKYIKDALKGFGIEHYYKAKLSPHILYVESSTDKSMLEKFAKKFGHPVQKCFDEKLNYYYTQNEVPEAEQDVENKLKVGAGFYKPAKEHFYAIKQAVGNLKGIGIFDGDDKHRQDEISENLALVYWKEYELENYFITWDTVQGYCRNIFAEQYANNGLFLEAKLGRLEELFGSLFLLPLFDGSQSLWSIYKKLTDAKEKEDFLKSQRGRKKTSNLLENVFRAFAKQEKEPMILGKGDFYKLIEFLEEMPEEVKEKLDLIAQYLAP